MLFCLPQMRNLNLFLKTNNSRNPCTEFNALFGCLLPGSAGAFENWMKGTGKDAGEDTTRETEPGRRSDAFHGCINAPARLCGDFAGIGVKAGLPHGSSADASFSSSRCSSISLQNQLSALPSPGSRSPPRRVTFA